MKELSVILETIGDTGLNDFVRDNASLARNREEIKITPNKEKPAIARIVSVLDFLTLRWYSDGRPSVVITGRV